MEIASLKKYAFLNNSKNSQDQLRKSLIFFTPSEELHGSNMFAKLSYQFNIIQPYLEVIDREFIHIMNIQVQNVAMYANPIYQNDYLNRKICELDQSIEEKQGKHELKFLKQTKIFDNTELLGINSGRVHMY